MSRFLAWLTLSILLLFTGLSSINATGCSLRWYVAGEVGGNLNKVIALDHDDIWLCGRISGLLHYDGESFTRILPERIKIGADAMDVTSDGNLWIVTHELTRTRQVFFHLQGETTVHCVQEVEGGWIKDIDMVTADEGWAVGNNGMVLRCQNHRWEVVDVDYSNFLYDVEMLDESRGWMVGSEGLVARFNGEEWVSISHGLELENYNAVSIIGKDDVWIVGNSGSIAHLRDGEWQAVESPTLSDLTCIEMANETLGWIGSISGEILEYHDETWKLCRSPVNSFIKDIDVLDGTVWFAVRTGEILKSFSKEVSQFRDVTSQLGLEYEGNASSPHVIDLNGDGREDLYVETSDEKNLVFLNRGKTFEKVGNSAGIERSRISFGKYKGISVAFGDYEGDGDVDCFMVDPFSSETFKLFFNDGSGGFVPRNNLLDDVDRKLAIRWSNFSKFVAEGGGRLSIFLTALEQQEKNTTAFLRIGEKLTLDDHPTPIGINEQYQAFAFGDLDSDGYADALVGTFQGDCNIEIYINDKGRGYRHIPLTVTNRSDRCYDINALALVDMNNDGLLDIVLIENLRGLGILLQEKDMQFLDVTEESGIRTPPVTGDFYTPALGDIDNDGDLDIVYLPRTMEQVDLSFIYINDGRGRFGEVSAISNLKGVSGCPVLFDYDDDGDLDLFVAHQSEPFRTSSRFFENMHDGDDFLSVKLDGNVKNRLAIGATVRIFEGGHLGEMRYFRGMRIAGAGENVMVTNNLGEVHFGAPDGAYDIEVTFSGGKKVAREGVHSGSRVIIHEDELVSRSFHILENAMIILLSKVSLPVEFLKVSLVILLFLILNKGDNHTLGRRKLVLFAGIIFLVLLYFGLSYRWIDDGLKKRELLPSIVTALLVVGPCLPRFVRRAVGLTRLSNYLVLGKIGEGATAVVYRAKDIITGRLVALKVLRDYLMAERKNLESFLMEAEIGTGLDHPHLVKIYERGRDKDKAFIVMEYIEGKSLSALIDDRDRFPEGEVLDLAIQVLHGLSHLHEAGIVHRDIKSANIIVTGSGRVKIMDFGLSKLLFRASTTDKKALVGTLRYISPEQVIGKSIDERSDLYSVGVVMYELLTGRLPFESENEVEIIRMILNDSPVPPGNHRGGISLFTDTIITKALRKSPEDRYRDAKEMLRDCEVTKRFIRNPIPPDRLRADMEEMKARSDRETVQAPESTPVPGVVDLLQCLGRSCMGIARAGVKTSSMALNDCIGHARRALGYLEFIGDLDSQIRVHYLLYRSYDRDENDRLALKHIRQAVEFMRKLLADLGDTERQAYLADEEIEALIESVKDLPKKTDF